MFVSFTDWEFDGNVDNAVEAAKGFWPEMKKYGAVNCCHGYWRKNTQNHDGLERPKKVGSKH